MNTSQVKMMKMKMKVSMSMSMRKAVLCLLFVTVLAPLLLFTDTFSSSESGSGSGSPPSFFFSAGNEFNPDQSSSSTMVMETPTLQKLPVAVVHPTIIKPSDGSVVHLQAMSVEHKNRVLSTTTIHPTHHNKPAIITQVTDIPLNAAATTITTTTQTDTDSNTKAIKPKLQVAEKGAPHKQTPDTKPRAVKNNILVTNTQIQYLKDQLIRAKVYLSLSATRNNAHFIRELRQRIKEVQRLLGDASKDSDLPRSTQEKLKAMEQTLTKGKQIQDDCSAMVKKLRAILHSTEEQLRVHRKQAMFLTQLTAKTLPKGLHCLPLRLSTEYYALNHSQQQFPRPEKLDDPQLYHYAIFSDNVLAAAVVVNSTVSHAKEPSKHVFHIVTDRLNYAAMKMWFLANPPSEAAIHVQNIEEFTWLNSSYSPVLKQLGSPNMIDYYFKTHRASSDSNLKFRNPKYLSILNHLRFYLPEIFPKLNKVLFLDDDIVIQKDLSRLWSIDLKGNVIGAVETCGETFHRFDRYLNFSNPLIAKTFDPHACGWAYGMNIFDLEEWKKQNITNVYHTWQELNRDRQLWKLGTLPPGLITFWKRMHPLDRSWHVLGLGYNPNVNQRDIEKAAVIHYNGNMKPWLEIGMPKYRQYWSKYIDYDHIYLRECNINP